MYWEIESATCIAAVLTVSLEKVSDQFYILFFPRYIALEKQVYMSQVSLEQLINIYIISEARWERYFIEITQNLGLNIS